ncbi:MAG: glgB [Panacagrimonas sp.]|nr:1,4-alpha-glucan branching protein GlgB [Panacagrimonas sp.]MCC2658104.1 glgB [Panacagrimonas sp.]
MDDVAPAELRLPDRAAHALIEATCGDPFSLLGPHPLRGGAVALRVFVPGAKAIAVVAGGAGKPIALQPAQVPGLFVGPLQRRGNYRLRIEWPSGQMQETEDPYAFGELLDHHDLSRFSGGLHPHLGRALGAHVLDLDGVSGVRFAVWAPNARRVSVVGDFNSWDGRRHPMRRRVEAGVWELFVPRVKAGAIYKYEVLGPHGVLPLRADPVAGQVQAAPETASVVPDPTPFEWTDGRWMDQRANRQDAGAPISMYEVHAESWRRPAPHATLGWNGLADQLIDYARGLGFTHIELMPVSAHPFGGSWGYQPLGLYAPHPPLGTPRELQRFVDRCHAKGLGVIVDWVPAHFPTDAHGLARFDGTALYEHEDPREGYHQDWNTLIFNLGRTEVQAHLIGSALHWLDHFHVDGLRVDAVASMLYRDYSRRAGEWVPNIHGGRENLEAVAFLRQFTYAVHEYHPGAITIAEESTAWPGVTHPVKDGGLGFDFKWNMGWMNDTLRYASRDPVHRRWAHDDIGFGLVYAFSERFVLPLSHDEVVHGKRSLLGRMPGDDWQRFANLRAYYGFMWAHPGKKLLFMGGEIAQETEWNHDAQLDWTALEGDAPTAAMRRGMQRLIGDLNGLVVATPALHRSDADPQGFEWIVGDDRDQSVFVFCRHALDERSPPVLAAMNFTPVPRHGYRMGVPRGGRWREVLNTDAAAYGGSGIGNFGGVEAQAVPCHGHAHSIELTLPPLGVVWLQAADAST